MEPQDTHETLVVFRVWKQEPQKGEVIALFPEIPHDINGTLCESYMHIGQHSGASYYGVVDQTRWAKPEEYAELQQELEQLGYRCKVRCRAQYNNHQARRQEASRIRRAYREADNGIV